MDDALFTLDEAGQPAAWRLFADPAPQPGSPAGERVVVPRPVANDRSGTRTPTPRYRAISRTDDLVQRLCNVSKAGASESILRLQSELGCQSDLQAGSQAAKMELIIQSEPTGCGTDPNIVACEPDGLKVEFAAGQYQFYAPGPGPKLFGSGAKAVDLGVVLIHEVGHWIGLSHSAVESNIMSESLENARCIDNSTRERLRAVVRAPGNAKPAFGAFRYSATDTQ